MSDIEFEETKIYQSTTGFGKSQSSLKYGLLMRLLLGIGVKDENTANKILIGIAVIFLCLTVFIYSTTFIKPETPNLTPEQEIERAHFITGTPA